MTDRDDTPEADTAQRTRADELADAVAGLGDTPEDQLATVAERNDSLQERLPDDDLGDGEGRAAGSPDQG